MIISTAFVTAANLIDGRLVALVHLNFIARFQCNRNNNHFSSTNTTNPSAVIIPLESNHNNNNNNNNHTAMKVIGPLLALDQVSACDGEQLHLRCPKELTIDIVTVSKTTLARDGTKRTKRATTTPESDQSNRVTSAASGTQQSWSSLSGNSQTLPADNREQMCRPRAGVTLTSTATGNTISAPNHTDSKLLQPPSSCPDVGDHHHHHGNSHDEEMASLQKLVFVECQQHNSCSLDLSWRNSSQAQNLSISGELSMLIHGATPPDACSPRKMLEVVYKCNPTKVKKSIACRGQTAAIECPDDKVILIGNANYGSEPFRPDNKRAYEKCSLNSSQEQMVMKQPLSSSCTSKQSATHVMVGECSLKRKCRLEANSSVFGETSCPPQWPLEYLTYIYICMSVDNLNKNATAYVQQLSQTNTGNVNLAAPHEAPPFVASSNVSSSSLLSSPTPSNFISPPSGPSGLLGPLNQNDSRQQSTSSNNKEEDVGLLSTNPLDHTQQQVVESPHQQDHNGAHHGPMTRVLSVVRADPELASLNPLNWDGMQRARYVWLRYKPQVVLVGVFALTTILLAFTIRVCKQHSARTKAKRDGSSKSSSSGSSSCRKSNSTSTSCSSTSSSSSSSASTLAAAAHLHKSLGTTNGPGSGPAPSSGHLKKHNSCSESCFSLEDYNCFATTGGGQLASADSPALISNTTPIDEHLQQMGQPPLSATSFQTSARPKFWSFYGNEQNLGSLRLASGHQHQHQINGASTGPNLIQRHNTMRATRTTFVNSRHQQQPVAPPLDGGVQVSYQAAGGGGGGGASDQYLLTMANVIQTAPGQQGWCLSGAADQTYQAQSASSPNDRQLLTLNAGELTAAAAATTTAPQVPCAFHAAGQQQQMFMQTNGLQLELPQPQHQHQLATTTTTTDNVINNLSQLHHHHHHQHHHHHNQQQQQQQQM